MADSFQVNALLWSMMNMPMDTLLGTSQLSVKNGYNLASKKFDHSACDPPDPIFSL